MNIKVSNIVKMVFTNFTNIMEDRNHQHKMSMVCVKIYCRWIRKLKYNKGVKSIHRNHIIQNTTLMTLLTQNQFVKKSRSTLKWFLTVHLPITSKFGLFINNIKWIHEKVMI